VPGDQWRISGQVLSRLPAIFSIDPDTPLSLTVCVLCICSLTKQIPGGAEKEHSSLLIPVVPCCESDNAGISKRRSGEIRTRLHSAPPVIFDSSSEINVSSHPAQSKAVRQELTLGLLGLLYK